MSASGEPSGAQQSQHDATNVTEEQHGGETPAGEPAFRLEAKPSGALMELDWASQLCASPGVEAVLTAGALLSPDSAMSPDHLFTALLEHHLVDDLVCLFDRQQHVLHCLVALGPNVCGHGHLVHGGMSAAVMDETLGALAYMLKREGIAGDGPAFTAHLEADYRKPLPAPASILCTASVASIQGRKIWVTAQILDRPNGVIFVEGKALFLTTKPAPGSVKLTASAAAKETNI